MRREGLYVVVCVCAAAAGSDEDNRGVVGRPGGALGGAWIV